MFGKSNCVRLTQSEANQIRCSYIDGKSIFELAEQFNVSKLTISNILNNKTYKIESGPIILRPLPWYVYMIQSMKDSSIYTGITLDIAARLKTHNEGRGARYTKGRGPFILLKSWMYLTKGEALRFEVYIKTLTKEDKLKL